MDDSGAWHLSQSRARLLRCRSQRLTPEAARAGAADVARDLCGVQAQVLGAAALSIRARSRDLREDDVLRALYTERSVVRTWLLRGTLHIAAAEDIGWLLGLLGPRFAAAGRGRRLQLGLDDAKCAKGIRAIRAILAAEGPLTRERLVEQLGRRGVSLDPKGQDRAHLIALAALEGVVCLGPGGGDERPTYALLEDWIGPLTPLPQDVALGHLAARYLDAYGPAGPEDLAVWAGIPVREARKGMQLISGDLVELDLDGSPAWMLAGALENEPEPGASGARLLAAFDTYLLGYRDRRVAMDAKAEARIQRGGGWIHPTVVVDGRVVGTWNLSRQKGRVEVSVELFQATGGGTRAAIDGEIADIRRFLGQP